MGAKALGNMAPDYSAPLEMDLDRRLRICFSPVHLEVQNCGGTCSAPKIEISMVSEAFNEVKRVDRERLVQELFREDITSNRIHAVSFPKGLKTPAEFARVKARASEAK